MRVLAIDPGTTRSAWCQLVWSEIEEDYCGPVCGRSDNDFIVQMLLDHQGRLPLLVIEKVEHYGRDIAVGADVFETIWWSGIFAGTWRMMRGQVERLPRRAVKLHLCGSPRAKDPNVRQSLIDLWGGKEVAIGRKASPGPLYGIAADEWAALAVARTWIDLHREEDPK